MGAIFLSYAREDRGCAEKLAHVLEGAGHEVWWDRRLDGGEEFSDEIEAALERCDVVLVAWSKGSAKSRWVRDEASAGVDSGRLVPVTIDGARPPMGFRQFHTLDLTGWKAEKRDGRTAELLRSVDRRLKGKGQAAPTTAPARKLAFPERRRWWMAFALCGLLVAVAIAAYVLQRAPARGPASRPTFALLPFNAASSDPELRGIAAQAREAISHTLSQSGIPVRLISSPPGNGRPAGDYLLSGEVGRSADKVTATIHLDEAAHGVTVFTQKFEATGNDVRNLPERIGAQLAGFLDGANLMILDRRHPIDPGTMAELLATSDDQLSTYQVMKRVAAKKPNELMAAMGVAFMTGFVLGELPADERPKAVKDARKAADKALKGAPKFGDTYATWCLLHSETYWAACEDQLRAGDRIDPDAPFINGFLALQLRRVGRFEESVGPTRLSYTHDPYNVWKIFDYLRTLELTGDSDGARKLYEQGIRWYPDIKAEFVGNRLIGLIDRGDPDAISRLEREVGQDAFWPSYRKSGVMVVDWKSPAAVRLACAQTADSSFFKVRCMFALADLGDQDAAYAIADDLYPRRVGRTPEETERIWLENPTLGVFEFITSPAAAGLRRDPRYLQLAQRTGLLAYWRSGRLPDFCHKQPEPICAQIKQR